MSTVQHMQVCNTAVMRPLLTYRSLHQPDAVSNAKEIAREETNQPLPTKNNIHCDNVDQSLSAAD